MPNPGYIRHGAHPGGPGGLTLLQGNGDGYIRHGANPGGPGVLPGCGGHIDCFQGIEKEMLLTRK